MRLRPRPSDLTVIVVACLATQATGAVALLALALRLSHTGSGWAVAGLWLAGTVPAVILAPVTGLALDRVETVRLMRYLALASAVLDVGLAAVPGVGLVLVLAVLLGMAGATIAPGMLAIAAPLGGASGPGATRSLTRLQAAQWTGAAVGPLVGAGLVVAWGTRIPLLLDGATLTLLAAGLGAVRARRFPAAKPPGDTWIKALGMGLAVLAKNSLLRQLMPAVVLIVTFVNVAVVVEVFLATQVFRAGPLGYGGLVAVWGAGLVLGTLAVPRLAPFHPLLVTGAGAALAALGLAAAGLSPGLGLALLAYSVGGFGNGLEMNSVRILVQQQAASEYHGRAFAAYLSIVSGAAAVGAVLGGSLLATVGPRRAMELAAIPVTGAAVWLLQRSTRKLTKVAGV
ncbi:MAG TPA: MFS transporter [Candidatus Dormibacteraeota bacterium]|nr:MFS transporter [Candidatus Dormibacteraeota bacterium]